MEASRSDLQNIKRADDELTIKEIILKLVDWTRYLWKNKLVIILVALAGAGLGVGYSLVSEPVYQAELSFVMEDNKAGSLGAYAGLASQFGIDLGGMNNSNSAFSGDNIIELLKSRLLVEKTLLSGRVAVNNKTVSLAEFYIQFNKLKEKWKNRPDLLGISFPIDPDRAKFNLVQDSLLNTIQSKVVKQNLKIEKIDKKLSFIDVKCTSKSEIFSKNFTEKLVEVATDFYVDTKTRRNKINVDRLQMQADSLQLILNRRTYQAAAAQDLNINPAKQVAGVGAELAMRDKMVSQTMYAEIVKNLELSKIAMVQDAPIIQIVDKPILPLERKVFSKLKGIIIGGFLAGALAVFILLIRKAVKDILA